MPHFKLKSGDISLVRFDGDTGEYALAFGQGRSIDGPATRNNYLWMEVDNWPCWERTLIEGPFIHHMAMTYGKLNRVFAEACRYVPGLKPVPLNLGNTQPG